jgi:hypothetical protein
VQAFAESPLDGTWKGEIQSAQFPEKPEQIELKNGRFSCTTCVPPIDVLADGTDQKTDAPYFDMMAVKVVDDRTVRFTQKKDGKVVGESTSAISADGNEIADTWTYYPPEGAPVKGAGRRARVGERVKGAHLLSGSWRIKKLDQLSDNAVTWTYKTTPDGLTMSAPTGESYDARFDGKDYPIKGDRAGTMVALKRIDERTVEETLKREGKVVGVGRYAVAADGKTMKVEYDDKEQGTKVTWTARRQQ